MSGMRDQRDQNTSKVTLYSLPEAHKAHDEAHMRQSVRRSVIGLFRGTVHARGRSLAQLH